MLNNFRPIMDQLLQAEGGLVNDPRDPGGLTDHGITARQWAMYSDLPLSKVTSQMLGTLTTGQINEFYRTQYWNVIDGDSLPSGIDCMVFHFEVNAWDIAVRQLQELIGVTADGVVGPRTLLALKGYLGNYGIVKSIQFLADRQTAYYEGLAGYGTFGEGWLARVSSFENLALRLASG